MNNNDDNETPLRIWACTAVREPVEFLVAAHTRKEAQTIADENALEALESSFGDGEVTGEVECEITSREQLTTRFGKDYVPWTATDDYMTADDLIDILEEYEAKKAAKAAYEANQLTLKL